MFINMEAKSKNVINAIMHNNVVVYATLQSILSVCHVHKSLLLHNTSSVHTDR